MVHRIRSVHAMLHSTKVTAAPAGTVDPAGNSTRTGVVLGIGTAIILGGSFPITGLLDAYPLFAGQMMRYAVGGLLLLAWARLAGVRLPRPTLRDLPTLMLLAVTGMVGFTWCVIEAQRDLSPGLLATIVGGSPILLALITPLLDGRRPSPRVVGAAFLIPLSVALVSGVGGGASPRGVLFAIGALVGEASFTIFAVGLIRRLGPVSTATYASLVAAGMCAVAGAVVDGSVPRLPTAVEAGALAFTAVAVTAVGFVLWYGAVARLGGDRAGLLVGLVPVSGLVMAVLIGAQQLTVVAVVGAAMVALATVFGLARARRGR